MYLFSNTSFNAKSRTLVISLNMPQNTNTAQGYSLVEYCGSFERFVI